jgi:hypothetical protein
MSYIRPSIFTNLFNLLTLRDFIIFFCVSYTVFDITGAVVAGLNHTGGGIIHDPVANTNNTVNLVITVKPVN